MMVYIYIPDRSSVCEVYNELRFECAKVDDRMCFGVVVSFVFEKHCVQNEFLKVN